MANKPHPEKSGKQRVLILGGGFGGVKSALELSHDQAFEVSLLSDQDDFRYYPTLYRTATGGAQAASSMPLGEIFAGHNVKLIKDSAKSLDRKARKVTGLSDKTYSYDVLIVALGAVTNFFGIKGLDKYSYGIKTLDESRRLRAHLHKQLSDQDKPDLNYVVVGGGPTGVELAGALPAYLRHIMKKHGVKSKAVNIDIVEAESRLLPNMPRDYSKAVHNRLKRLGVKFYLNQAVQAETADALMVNGKPIASHTVIWTAGVTNHPFLKANNFRLTERGKVIVDQYLQAEPGIYVIGDNAATPYSGMAQTALYDGSFLAANLKLEATGKRIRPYKPKKPVYVTPVGPHWAAVLWNKTHIYGWLGWMIRNLADFIGYHDVEPWQKASKQLLASFESEEICPVCNRHPG